MSLRPLTCAIIVALFACTIPVVWSQNAGTEPAAQVVPRSDEASKSASNNTSADQDDDIRIGGGDLLSIKVFGVPDLDQEQRVSNAGEVYLALIGEVHVSGLTQQQASELIETKLREGEYLRNPHVSVAIKEYATQGVSVLGEVARPGVYPLLGARRLFDVISLAGGLTDRAGKVVTITHRDDPDNPQKVELAADPMKAADANVAMSPGDTVLVARAGVVYVVGDVAHPSGFTLSNNQQMTVLQAIALAGGTNSTAALGKAKIIRRTPQGVQQIPVPLKSILSAKSDDAPMKAEDVLFVPTSAAKGAARRSAEAILQVTTGLAIYRR